MTFCGSPVFCNTLFENFAGISSEFPQLRLPSARRPPVVLGDARSLHGKSRSIAFRRTTSLLNMFVDSFSSVYLYVFCIFSVYSSLSFIKCVAFRRTTSVSARHVISRPPLRKPAPEKRL